MSCTSKRLLKVKTVNTKKYGREVMINNVISSGIKFKKIISSHALHDLSYSTFKSLVVKLFLETYSNNSSIL